MNGQIESISTLPYITKPLYYKCENMIKHDQVEKTIVK